MNTTLVGNVIIGTPSYLYLGEVAIGIYIGIHGNFDKVAQLWLIRLCK